MRTGKSSVTLPGVCENGFRQRKNPLLSCNNNLAIPFFLRRQINVKIKHNYARMHSAANVIQADICGVTGSKDI